MDKFKAERQTNKEFEVNFNKILGFLTMLHSPFIILTRVWVFLRLMLSHFVCQKNLPPRNLDFTRPENVQQKKK